MSQRSRACRGTWPGLVVPYFLPRAHRKLFSPHLTIGARPLSPQDPGPRTIPDRNGLERTGTDKAPRILPDLFLFFPEIKQFCFLNLLFSFSFCFFTCSFCFLLFFRSSCCRRRGSGALSFDYLLKNQAASKDFSLFPFFPFFPFSFFSLFPFFPFSLFPFFGKRKSRTYVPLSILAAIALFI